MQHLASFGGGRWMEERGEDNPSSTRQPKNLSRLLRVKASISPEPWHSLEIPAAPRYAR